MQKKLHLRYIYTIIAIEYKIYYYEISIKIIIKQNRKD